MTTNSEDLTLVLGATGKTGSRVARRLTAVGHPVRLGSRSAQPSFDWEDPTTWSGALDGVSAVYIAYVPDLALPGAAEVIGAFADQAVAAGVRRLALLSGRGETEAGIAERRVQGVDADVTVLRASWFNQNFSESFLLPAVLSGVFAAPAGRPEPFTDVEDIAEVAAAVLTQDGHAGKVYELTGPRSLTFAEAMAEISAASGLEVRYQEITADEFRAGLESEGTPPELVDLFVYLFTEVLDGRNSVPTDDVQQVLGRPARGFSDWAREAATAGAWSAATLPVH
ncbi:NmrA family transcriptional regulator [Occultella glacieicola]|uniref:NmrA family transcriptional regulator n=1 Tax=Occultella glacieicola TaxID=2518684 RepID=A0ABY2E8E8_9MICO|nr:NAD(P)H-binding protein [Occultella glacieicola]TDE94992.1 NmrA family transcriptional regulator [Occultella glacieicola]